MCMCVQWNYDVQLSQPNHICELTSGLHCKCPWTRYPPALTLYCKRYKSVWWKAFQADPITSSSFP